MKKFLLLAGLFASISIHAQLSTGSLLWQHATQGRIVATPALHDAKIYFGNEAGKFFCNAATDGRALWTFSTGGAIRSSAAVADGTVYFGSEDGRVYALDALNGKLRWQFVTGGEHQYDLWDYYRSSPVYHKGVIYVGSGDSNVYAINARTGREVWRFRTGGIVHADPVIDHDTLYVGSFDGRFYALHAGTGQLIWQFKTIGDRFFPKGEVQKAALVTADAVYFGSRDYNIYALQKRTGAGLWNMKEYGSWITATPMEKDGKLFFGTSDSHAFYCLNNFYGEQQWKAHLPLRSYATPVCYDSLVIAGCFDGILYGFGEKTGTLRWKFQTTGSRNNYATVFDERGKFRSDFSLYGSDPVTQASEQKIMGLGAILSTPVIRDGVIYFGATDGYLYAVRIN